MSPGLASFRKRYIAFLNELSKLARKHDELTDTEVRERLHEVINYHFVWSKPMTGFAERYSMMSAAGDRALAPIVKKFVTDARRIADAARIGRGAARHELLQDPAAKSRRGELFDEFLGSSDPVLPARKPTPDSTYEYVESKKKTSRSPPHDPKVLKIKFKGKVIVPTFDGDYYWFNVPGSISVASPLKEGESAMKIRRGVLAGLLEYDLDETTRARFRKRYVAYLERLRALSRDYGELLSPDVRVRLRGFIDYFFIWGKPLKAVPKRFSMSSARADRAVATATYAFVRDGRRIAERGAFPPGIKRYSLIQDWDAKTRRGNRYVEFLGQAKTLEPARKPASD